mgnify:CR=1 FL=1
MTKPDLKLVISPSSEEIARREIEDAEEMVREAEKDLDRLMMDLRRHDRNLFIFLAGLFLGLVAFWLILVKVSR